jgi:hypothetical protein
MCECRTARISNRKPYRSTLCSHFVHRTENGGVFKKTYTLTKASKKQNKYRKKAVEGKYKKRHTTCKKANSFTTKLWISQITVYYLHRIVAFCQNYEHQDLCVHLLTQPATLVERLSSISPITHQQLTRFHTPIHLEMTYRKRKILCGLLHTRGNMPYH